MALLGRARMLRGAGARVLRVRGSRWTTPLDAQGVEDGGMHASGESTYSTGEYKQNFETFRVAFWGTAACSGGRTARSPGVAQGLRGANPASGHG